MKISEFVYTSDIFYTFKQTWCICTRYILTAFQLSFFFLNFCSEIKVESTPRRGSLFFEKFEISSESCLYFTLGEIIHPKEGMGSSPLKSPEWFLILYGQIKVFKLPSQAPSFLNPIFITKMLSLPCPT